MKLKRVDMVWHRANPAERERLYQLWLAGGSGYAALVRQLGRKYV